MRCPSRYLTTILLQLPLLTVDTTAFNGVPIDILRRRTSSSFLEESPKSSSAFWKDLNLSRRDAIIFSIGGIGYGKLIGDVLARIIRGDHYPPEHEGRVSTTFERTITLAANRLSASIDGRKDDSAIIGGRRPLRVLEIGIGSACRTVTVGLYDNALANVSASQASPLKVAYPITNIDIIGADIDLPNPDVLKKAQDKLSTREGGELDLPVSLEVIKGDITDKLPFSDGYFDAITCSLVLCSVSSQETALNEIKRLLNPTKGVFGYVEHVAVQLKNAEEKNKRSFLEWQQRTLDPLQQAVAHNCHLHRDTDAAILNVFLSSDASSEILYEERFFVDDMWPVSCQCCGVIALNSKRA